MSGVSGNVLVIGGGIVGLATADALSQRHPRLRVGVIEKESTLAAHQTGRNSGVIHSGVYYRPGSLKAQFCREGKAALERFCQEEGVPFERCGKVIVATSAMEVPRLRALEDRARANGVLCSRLGKEALRDVEPAAAGVEALHIPGTGIVDYRAVCERLAERVRACGGEVITSAKVLGFEVAGSDRVVRTTRGDFRARWMVNCGGVYSDRLAAAAGAPLPGRIVPFRGEYYALQGRSVDLVRHLIYPVPDPEFPFLGVHFTRMIRGGAECGPNAVLALAREGYGKLQVSPRDLSETLSFEGFRKLARRHWRMAMGEIWRSFSKAAFVKALQRLVPEVRAADLAPAPAGIRAQAVTASGGLVDDFLFEDQPGFVHVLNAPSPAATAALRIGIAIAERLEQQFGR